MNVNIKDTITLSDDNSYVVTSKANYQNGIYYYLVDIDNMENIKFCIENIKNTSLIEVDDKDLIKQLLPLFIEATSKSITKEDIDLLLETDEQ